MTYKSIGIIVVLSALIAGCGNPTVRTESTLSQNGYLVKPYTVAGGQKVLLKVSKRGAVPAEDAKIRITAAAVLVGSLRENEPVLVWSFGLTSKTADKISKITVENVFPDDPAALLVMDEQPKFRYGDKSNNGYWIGRAEKGDPKDIPWLRSKGISEFVFRFTVFFEDGTQSTLYQLCLFSDDHKQFFINAAENVRKKDSANNFSKSKP
ncbi:MAG: hypothetical protein LBS70_02905 [Candidatus Accumulibacter sp.]|jgi:hypothetical protein|nr:hypothetical protein [Accumulibacter sp.]